MITDSPTTSTHIPLRSPSITTPKSWSDLVAVEPRLIAMERRAAHVAAIYGRRRPRSFWASYEILKRDAAKLVGWHSRRPEIASSLAYEIATGHIFSVCCGRSLRRRPGRGD